MHAGPCATLQPVELRTASSVKDWYKRHQREWAEHKGLPLADPNHTATVDVNLFEPLSSAARAQFLAGAGNELDDSRGPPDLSSLRSSTALCVNTLHAWTGSSRHGLAKALDVEGELRDLRFESKFPTGLRGRHPHLDASAQRADGGVVAIEAKFLEPLGTPTRRFRPSYLSDQADWSGLDNVRTLALELQRSNPYARLGAVQLIRHILGLRHQLGARRFVLVYLYYDMDHRFGEDHTKEVEDFARFVSPDIKFTPITYQHLWTSLNDVEPADGYFDYLFERYGKEPIRPG